ncbi:hypothetical protein AAFF_G00254130 [Aldrovandia affinis]|uniref:C2 domain-containing protein n=1 Tax=Aldrovandia affinis TaxID=143900 RepID=A0AAD7RCV7_9TELE|nr:hypothetical protein AAFF_G00254130 [Aldrovandia affinis]
MAFFRSFQQSLPSVSSILDSVSTVVDDLASAVGDATYTVSDQLAEQVTTLMSKVQTEEEEQEQEEEEEESAWRKREEARAMESIASPKGQSRKHRGESDKDAASPSDDRAPGGRSRKSRGEADSSPTDGVAGKDGRGADRETANGVHPKDSGSESPPPPKSKVGKDKARHPTKENGGGRREEEGSPEKAKTFDATQTDDGETAGPDEGSESPKPEKEEEDKEKKKAARAGKGQKDSSRKDSGKPVDGTGKEQSRQKPGKDGDLWESSSESDSEKTRKPAQSACHSQAGRQGADPPSQHSYGWETQRKHSGQSAQCEGYSSEASTEDANCIQRMSRSPAPPEEQRPPPYQDHHGSPRIPRRPSDGSDDHEGEARDKDKEPEQEEDVPSDSTAVLGQEDTSAHGSALLLSKGYEPEPLAKYGTLDVAFDYDSGEQRLAVTVTAATDIPALRRTGNVAWQVHLVLLPTKQQRAKTGVQKGPCPVFTETFKFTCVESEAIGSYAVRFRLYSVRRMRKERVMGEKVFYLTKLNLQGKMSVPVTLDPGCTLTQGCGSLRSVSCSEGVSSYRSTGQTSRPEILLGLLYNSTTGRLSVEVVKGSHLRDIAPDKPPTLSDGLFCCLKHLIGGQLYIIPDTYVKLTMMNSMGQEMSKCKTSTCRGQPDPTYKETFVFQVALFQLSEVSLLVSVYSRRGVKRRDRVGWVSLGLNTSGEVETSHWAQMREAEGQQVCRWHTLLDS